ncbi:uncharacterized protein LOC127736867 [Mytilus californianus]|uniref:uncharacterized protein LOC127736867 n=1 Tax=Mytilus californianus TaxID=6549 RepID=UPI00224855AF|nr:uncharacterized protein LOC127736867 [Mytilus californianus]
MEFDNTCLHCQHYFDVNNLKTERRRKLMKHSDVDLIETIANCYQLEENLLRKYVEENEDTYVCDACFKSLKTIYNSQKKCKQLTDTLKEKVSNNFKNLTIKLEYVRGNNSVKRNRDCLTPSKTGCTPKGKKLSPPRGSTPKGNRRRLQFSTPIPRTQTQSHSQNQSPGPKVKVQIDYRHSKRKTNLQGPTKLACRALVMKQYKTALNHLLQIDEVKKELVNTVKKTINQEVNKVCSDKNSVLRSSNIARFSWKTVHKQLLNTCPTTVDLLRLLAGKKENNVPRVVSSLAILLFSRNQQINTFQAINSVLMFRGHVRTKVYTTFNRAGLCTSYKSTLSTIDRICESFDLPVKKWANKVAEMHNKENSNTKDSSLDDHSYAIPIDIETETKMEDTCIYTAEPLFESPIDHSRLDTSGNPDLSQENLHLPTPIKCGSYESEELLQTPACKIDLSIDMDSPFTTTIPVEASSESGPFQIVMDNLNLHQKTRHKTLDTSNKVHNLVHSIGIQHRVTTDLESLLPQADILSIPNEAFVPNQTDHDDLYADFQILIQRALVTYIPELKDFRDLVTFHIEHQYSKASEKKSDIVPLGILEKDENITEQMIEVVQHLQQYVPKTNDGKFIPILLGGDALSVERGEAASRARMDAITEEDRLEGFTWKSEDWHGHVISLQTTLLSKDQGFEQKHVTCTVQQ